MENKQDYNPEGCFKLIAAAIAEVFNPKMSKSLKYRSLNLGQARLSRSNVHFRW